MVELLASPASESALKVQAAVVLGSFAFGRSINRKICNVAAMNNDCDYTAPGMPA